MKGMNKRVTKKVFIVSGLLFLLSAVINCNRKEPVSFVPDDYTSWDTTTDIMLDYPIPGHENHFRIIRINDTGKTLRPETRGKRIYDTYPTGTVIVKEIYPELTRQEDDRPIMLTVMVKEPSHQFARGGWLWNQSRL